MKISIWRQFSSNHSASFQMVGTFDSVEKAMEAAEHIRHILREIATYWQNLPAEDREARWDRQPEEITPIEQALSQRYGVEWSRNAYSGEPHRIDWIPADPERTVQAVLQFEHCVFMENIGNTDVGTEPFETLLRKWGASIAAWREVEGTLISMTTTCLAPDEDTAERLLGEVEVITSDDEFARQGVVIGHALMGYSNRSAIRREGRKLIYPLNALLLESINHFPMFFAYLRENGCTEIEYQFSEG